MPAVRPAAVAIVPWSIKARPSYDVNPGKLLLELVAKIVVSGCCQAIEKTRSCKLKCAGAD